MRDRIISLTLYLFFALLAAGLFYTQIIRFPYYARLSRNNSIRIIPIDGPRGNIFDRNGVLLVTNRLSFDATVIYQELKDKKKLADLLYAVLGMPAEDVEKSLKKASRTPYAPVAVAEDVGKEKAIVLEEASLDIRGLVIETRCVRDYMNNEEGCHIFGYLSEISEKELADLKDYGYRAKNPMGRDGIEKQYNKYLAGVDGGLQVEVDNRGRAVRTLGLKEPSSGVELRTSVDSGLQSVSDRLLGQKPGAVIVMDPRDGQILALASHPSYDPNLFVRSGMSSQRVRLLRDKKGRPMLNRAISGLYPPGSVFKIAVATAALQTKKITRATTFFCNGSYKLGEARFDCWKESGHGVQDIASGLMNSCNVFFYNTGKRTGVDNIEAYGKLFGFGRPTGIDLPDEAKGILPGRAWKLARKKDTWYEGDTLNYSIGQGYLLVTPLQILEMMACIANGGRAVRPHIVTRIGTTEVLEAEKKSLGLDNGAIQQIREGLYKVVNDEGGTGKRAGIEGVKVAGKTGTAQNPRGRTHAWFAGFAPYNAPTICLVVFLEHGGHGGVEPAEIARGVFEEAKKKGYL